VGKGKGKEALGTLHYQRDLWRVEKMEEGCENMGGGARSKITFAMETGEDKLRKAEDGDTV
jgi:hypothetical protein